MEDSVLIAHKAAGTDFRARAEEKRKSIGEAYTHGEGIQIGVAYNKVVSIVS